MALSLPAEFVTAAEQAGAEVLYLLELYDGTTTWKAVSGRWKDAGQSDHYPAAIHSVDQISAEMDPLERDVQMGGVSIEVRDNWLRPILASNTLRGQRARLYIGFRGIAEGSFQKILDGVVEDHVPDGNGLLVTLELLDVWDLLSKIEITGEWIAMHPLGIMEDILQKANIPTALYNSSDFDPSNYTGSISHFVSNRGRVSIFSNVATSSPEADTTTTPAKAMTLLNELAKMMMGTLAVSDGVLRFNLFDSSAASSKDWTADDIVRGTFKNIETKIVNRVAVKFGNDLEEFVYRPRDDTSAAKYAYPGESTRYFDHEVKIKWLSEPVVVLNENLTSGETDIDLVGFPCAIAGSRGALDGPQPSDATISASRPGYYVVERDTWQYELVKAEGMSHTTSEGFDYESTVEGAQSSVTSLLALTTLTSVTRGVWTSGRAHSSGDSVLDITVPIYLADKILDRYSDGAPVVELETTLRHFDNEIGDLVTVTRPEFLEEGYDGITSSDKWEIVKKELQLEGAPTILWRLVWAGETSNTRTEDGWPRLSETMSATQIMKDSLVAENHVANGFSMSDGGSLDLDITKGTVSAEYLSWGTGGGVTKTLSASKDTYIRTSPLSGGFLKQEVSVGSGDPGGPAHSVLLGVVTTDATSITVIDQTGQPSKALDGSKLVAQSVDTSEVANDAIQTNQVLEATLGTYHLDKKEQTTNMVANGNFGVATKG